MKSVTDPANSSAPKSKFLELCFYFLRLGLTGFGGPLALIVDMQRELVEKRKWISNDEFRQVFTVIKSMPGPIAFQTAMYLGYRRTNRFGSLMAGVLLILPAALMMILLATQYQAVGQNPNFIAVFGGFQAAALVLIVLALQPLTRGLIEKPRFWGLAVVSFLLLAFHLLPEPLVIAFAALWSISFDDNAKPPVLKEAAFSLLALFWICFKAGAFVFGTGLAIVPLLERDFVQSTGWVNQSMFMDALAFGQLTPGPVSVTVTFLGYTLAGGSGAALATVAIFLPSALHHLTWFPRFVSWMGTQKWLEAFVLGASAAIAAGIVVALLSLSRGMTSAQIVIFAVLLLILLRWRIPSWTVILLGGLMNWIFASILMARL